MKYIVFKTDIRGIEYNQRTSDGKIETHKDNVPVAVGVCPQCGAILFSQQGIYGETLHRIAQEQMGNSLAYCHVCGENYAVGPIIEAKYEVITDEAENG